MKEEDLIYLLTNISDLCGIPGRIYKKDTNIFFHYGLDLIKDPFVLNKDELLIKTEDINYITTSDFFYYAYVKYNDYKLILGPFRLIKPDERIITRMALQLEIDKDEIDSFVSLIKTINPLPLETVLHSLCMIYFILTDKKKMISEILVDDAKTKSINQGINEEIKNKEMNDINDAQIYSNNTYIIEKELCRIVEHGQIDELRGWIKNSPSVRPGILSNDTIRHTKNTFIAATTIISRAAIKGNLDPDEALALSDLYIQKMELLQNGSDIMALQVNMILDYTERVAKINGIKNASSLLIELNKYILSHLSEAIKIEDICKTLFISKSVLFAKIKKETDMTVSNYILYVKVNEAKSLLKYTNQSIASISIYLGFSSQSHFNHAFKKFTNTTPIKYRLTHK